MEKKTSGAVRKAQLRMAVAAVLAAATLAVATNARADGDMRRTGTEAGMGLATAVANLLYLPAKSGYAAIGSVTGGLGYVLTAGNKDVAENVWTSSMGGDYVLNRQQIKGEEEIHFAGGTGTSSPDM